MGVSFDVKKYNNHRKLADKLINHVKEWYFDKCNEYKKLGYEFFCGIED